MIGVGFAFLALYGDGIKTIAIRYLLAIATAGIFAIINRSDIIILVNYVKKRFFGKNG